MGIAFGALALLTLVVLVVVDKVRKHRELRAMTNASGPAVIATQRNLMRSMEDRGGYPQTSAARV